MAFDKFIMLRVNVTGELSPMVSEGKGKDGSAFDKLLLL